MREACADVKNTWDPSWLPAWDASSDKACNAWMFKSWGKGLAELAGSCAKSQWAQRECALTCCCANVSLRESRAREVEPLHNDRARHWWGHCSARLATARRSTQEYQCAGRPLLEFTTAAQPASQAPNPTPIEPPRTWTHYKILGTLGRGLMGSQSHVRFPNGFECAMKSFKASRVNQNFTAVISAREARHQRIAAAAGVGPLVYHHSSEVQSESVIYSELMVREAWDRAWGPTACGAQAKATCNEMIDAMQALDRAGVLHRDLKLQHFMRAADGRIKIVDYSRSLALATPEPCLHGGANAEDFVMRNPCFHLPARAEDALEPRNGRGPYSSTDHWLADFVERAPAAGACRTPGRNLSSAGQCRGPPLSESQICFATACFPAFVQAIQHAQRRARAMGAPSVRRAEGGGGCATPETMPTTSCCLVKLAKDLELHDPRRTVPPALTTSQHDHAQLVINLNASQPSSQHSTGRPSSASSAGGRDSCAPPRRVAICISGSARGFSSPIVLQHLRRHFIDALGGSQATLFLLLKTEDSEKTAAHYEVPFAKHRNASVASIQASLQLPWLRETIGEAIIAIGSGAVHASTRGTRDGRVVESTDEHLWRRYALPVCSDWEDFERWRSAGRCCLAPTLVDADEHILLAHLGLKWCAEAIGRYEEQHKQPFDVVAYTRPDAIWWEAVPRRCAADASILTSAYAQFGASDRAFVAPRSAAPSLLGQADLHRDCAHALPPDLASHMRKAARPGRLPARPSVQSCCTARAEDLLVHSLAAAGGSLSCKAPGVGCTQLTHIKWNTSFLRQPEGACEGTDELGHALRAYAARTLAHEESSRDGRGRDVAKHCRKLVLSSAAAPARPASGMAAALGATS